MSVPEFGAIRYEVDGPVATLTLNRPDAANAQSTQMLEEIDAALDLADADDAVRVVVVAGEGKHFSAGHDLKEILDGTTEWARMRDTAEGKLRHEQVMYWDKCVRLRDFRKPTIAAVQGACAAAGLMLASMCDLIVAADDARFSNPVARMTGVGVELLVEPWELGPRKAKEFLLCATTIGAADAERFGLVNKVVPRAELAHAAREHGRPGRARPAGHRRGDQGHDQPHDRWPGSARVVALPLHGAPVREQQRDRARGHRRPESGRDGRGEARAGRRVSGPLDGLRVLDLGTRIAAPFCAGLLGEQGAEVVKIEQPGTGDFMREIGPFAPADDGTDYSLFWAVEGRGRQSVTLDLRRAEGQDLFRRLAATADVVVENFRPGTLEKWHLAPPDLPDRLVTVRISSFGQDGPNAPRPGLDRVGIGYGGLLHLTGYPDRPPVRVGVTISDYLTGVFAAQAATAALYARDARGGTGAVIDAALYGATLRILEWTLPAYDKLGTIRSREGNRLANSAPLDNYPTADGKFVCIVAGSDANFARLCKAMDRPDLPDDPRFAAPRGSRRAQRRDQWHRRRLDRGALSGRDRGALCRVRRARRDGVHRGRHLRRRPHRGSR